MNWFQGIWDRNSPSEPLRLAALECCSDREEINPHQYIRTNISPLTLQRWRRSSSRLRIRSQHVKKLTLRCDSKHCVWEAKFYHDCLGRCSRGSATEGDHPAVSQQGAAGPPVESGNSAGISPKRGGDHYEHAIHTSLNSGWRQQRRG